MDFKNIPANIGMLDGIGGDSPFTKVMNIPFPSSGGSFWDYCSGHIAIVDIDDYSLLVINVMVNGSDASYYKDFTFNIDLSTYGKKVDVAGYTRLGPIVFNTGSFRLNCSTAQKTENPLIISMGFTSGTTQIDPFSSFYVIPLANA